MPVTVTSIVTPGPEQRRGFSAAPAIDHARRQMQQQIDQPRRLAAVEQIAEQFVLPRSDAGQLVTGANSGLSSGGRIKRLGNWPMPSFAKA